MYKRQDYVNFRPSYPAEIVDILKAECALNKHSIIADIGSGTGKLTELLLLNELTVHAVEPNKEMREAAENLFGDNFHFNSVAGEAEATKKSLRGAQGLDSAPEGLSMPSGQRPLGS